MASRIVRNVLRVGAALAALAPLTGCRTWEPVTSSPARLIVEERPSTVRVRTADGAEVTVRSPRVVNDSLVSAVRPSGGTASPAPLRFCLPCGDVRSVEVARFSPVRSAGLAAAIVAVSVAMASFAGDSEGGTNRPGEPLPKATGSWGFRILVPLGR